MILSLIGYIKKHGYSVQITSDFNSDEYEVACIHFRDRKLEKMRGDNLEKLLKDMFDYLFEKKLKELNK